MKEMPTPRAWHTSSAVDGKIYVMGGTSDGTENGVLAAVEEFTPQMANRIEHISIDDNKQINFSLYQNYPNPFNPTTTIEYSLAQSGHVRVSIYNLFSQRIRTLVDEEQSAGVHTSTWNATDESGNRVSSGIYLSKIEFINPTRGRKAWQEERKMVLLK